MTARGVSPWNLQARNGSYDKFVKNPSARDRESGLYFPILTSYRRKNVKLGWETIIKIQFSAPKLIYGNNLDELADSQFETVTKTLQDRLKRVGVIVSTQDLESAAVTSVHYSKNVELKNGYTSQYVIAELNKINLNKRFDLTKTRFMNDGQSLCAYAVSHSFVIYDKIADLARGPKRAIDKEQTRGQLSLFEKLNKTSEVLRFEARLSKKQKINALFKKLSLAENPTFKDVFSAEKSKAVLMHYWNTMVAGNSALLFAHSFTSKDLLKQVLLAHRNVKAKEALYRVGLLCAIREGNGMRELRTILSKRINDRTWYHLVANAKETATSLTKLKPRDWYYQVEAALESYQPFHIIGRM